MRSEIVLYFFKTFKFVAVVTLCILLMRTFIIEPGKVNGRSMEPAFYDDHLFFINKFILLFTPLKRGQVVQYRDPDLETSYIKRIIGLPGEKIAIKQNKVFIIGADGQEKRLEEAYLGDSVVTRSPTGEAEVYGPIPDNQYFVLGDNREESIDSRYLGSIRRSYINGLVLDLSFLKKEGG